MQHFVMWDIFIWRCCFNLPSFHFGILYFLNYDDNIVHIADERKKKIGDKKSDSKKWRETGHRLTLQRIYDSKALRCLLKMIQTW